jgi:pimeloyl-ACP methyl ester carboxylesterase
MTAGVIDRLEIDANGLTFTARAAGPDDGRRVILLHGFPQTSWSWRAQLSALGDAGYRAVAPDQRGYSAGCAAPNVADYGLDHLVSDVLALADTMEMDTFDLVGHDWGGHGVVGGGRPAPRTGALAGVVSTPHPLALRHALLGGDPEQAGGRPTWMRSAPAAREVAPGHRRLGVGPARRCVAGERSGCFQHPAVSRRAHPAGGVDRGTELVPGHGSRRPGRSVAGHGPDALRVVDGRCRIRPARRGGVGRFVAGGTIRRCSRASITGFPKAAPKSWPDCSSSIWRPPEAPRRGPPMGSARMVR